MRRSFRGIKTVRGAIFFLLGLAAMLMWLGPQVMVFFVATHAAGRSAGAARRSAAGIARFVADVHARQCHGMEGIHFTAAEVDFLFSGPFSRRQLLLYKLTSGVFAAFFTALFFSIMLMRYASLWTAVFLGFFLTMVFMHLLTTALVLAGQTLAERMYTRRERRLMLIILGLVVVCCRAPASRLFSIRVSRKRPAECAVRPSGFGSLCRWNRLFGQFPPNRFFPDLIGWALAAAAVDLALLAIVVRIDVNYMESSLVASQKRYAMLQRRRSTGRMVVKPHVAWRVPQLPWLGGAGPIAWRQLTTAIRSIHGLLIIFLIFLCLAAGPLLSKMQNSSEVYGNTSRADRFFHDILYPDAGLRFPRRPGLYGLGQVAAA